MMGISIRQVLLITLVVQVFAGCSSRGDYQEWGAHIGEDDCFFPDNIKEPAPKWVCTETWESAGLSAVGSYHKTGAGIEFQKSMAMAEARARMAELADIRVQQLIKQHAQSSTKGTVESSTRSDSLIRREIIEKKLPGTELYVMTINPETKRMYVLVGMDASRSERYFTSIINTELEISNQSSADERALDQALSLQ